MSNYNGPINNSQPQDPYLSLLQEEIRRLQIQNKENPLPEYINNILGLRKAYEIYKIYKGIK